MEFLYATGTIEKNYSKYTIVGYISSIEDFERFLHVQGIKGFEDVTYPDVRIFLTEAHEKGLTRRTISKKISALRIKIKNKQERNEQYASRALETIRNISKTL
ncbi:hypothetical protein DT075_25090 [Bacillus licheniformis]|nr:hypothetical protein DT075_25090 [Bacillus licheniformis]